MRPDPDTLKQAVKELGIDVPVHVARVVGGRLELIVQGGIHYQWPMRQVERHDRQQDSTPDESDRDPRLPAINRQCLVNPAICSKAQLQEAAKLLNIAGRGKMTKAQLVEAIETWRDAQVTKGPA